MDNILNSIDKYSLDLLKQCMLSNSAASCFYTHLYNNRVLFKIGIITFCNHLLNLAKNTKSVVFLSTVFHFLF